MSAKNSERPRILIFCDYYLPGYKSGGGMRTIVNITDRLGDRFDFFVVTRDHDGELDREPYKNVRIGAWNRVGKAEVYYLAKDEIKLKTLRRLIVEVSPDALYFNSFFATLAIYVLLLRKTRSIPELPILLAPCGELSDGALKIKSRKKKLFVASAKTGGLYKNLIWKASSELEKTEIARIDDSGEIFIVPDLSPKTILPEFTQLQKPRKRAGAAKMIFLSRFVRKKNFKWLLEVLPGVKGNLEIDVWGPLEDGEYWSECKKVISALPENIKIAAQGLIPHHEAAEKMREYHFFVLPTLGENFGHVFVEALAAGCPLVISDLTPWRDLESRKVGWDLPLDQPEKWIETLNYCIGLNDAQYSEFSSNARHFAVEWLGEDSIERKTENLLIYSLRKNHNKTRLK